MMSDILTVAWKEWKEVFLMRGSGWRGGIVGIALIVFVFGVFMPLQTGREWVESAIPLGVFSWVPFLMVSGVIADSFAGERERHTLETLLASRLSDRAILLGKVAAAIGYGWGIVLASVAVGLITINLAFGRGRVLMFDPALLAGIVLGSLLASSLAASIGVLVSLRAATVRQAAQTLSLSFMLLFFIPVFGLQALPGETQARILQFLSGLDPTTTVLGLVAFLVLLNVILLAAAMARFQRARLILD